MDRGTKRTHPSSHFVAVGEIDTVVTVSDGQTEIGNATTQILLDQDVLTLQVPVSDHGLPCKDHNDPCYTTEI